MYKQMLAAGESCGKCSSYTAKGRRIARQVKQLQHCRVKRVEQQFPRPAGLWENMEDEAADNEIGILLQRALRWCSPALPCNARPEGLTVSCTPSLCSSGSGQVQGGGATGKVCVPTCLIRTDSAPWVPHCSLPQKAQGGSDAECCLAVLSRWHPQPAGACVPGLWATSAALQR